MVSSSSTNIVPCRLEEEHTCCVLPEYYQDVYLQFLELLFYEEARPGPGPGRGRAKKVDRHRKINTARGPRDRRMRLSVEVAKSLFRLQDLLGYDKPSSTVQWLLTNAAPAIAQLQPTSTSSCQHDADDAAANINKVVKNKTKTKRVAVLVGRESRIKARARARERTRRRHHHINTMPMPIQQYNWNTSLITNYNQPAPTLFTQDDKQVGELEPWGWGEEAAFNTFHLSQ